MKKGNRIEQKMGLHDKKNILVGFDRDIDSLWNKLEGDIEFFFFSFFSFSWRRLSQTKSWLETDGCRDSLGGQRGVFCKLARGFIEKKYIFFLENGEK